MSNILKYILISLGVIILEWIFIAVIVSVFDASAFEAATTLGVGFFLAIEITICTGIILSKIEKNK